MPIRVIPKSYRNVTGMIASDKSIGIAGFESTLERDVLQLMEFDPGVKSFEIQPVRIQWQDSKGRKRLYTPDLVVRFTSKKPILYEIKYLSDISEVLKEQREKFKASISFARSKGWRFKFFSEKCIDPVLLKNIKFLLPYISQGPREEGHLQSLDEQLNQLETTTPSGLLNTVTSNQWVQANLLPSLWYMVGVKEIGVDLKKPLTMSSRIWSLES